MLAKRSAATQLFLTHLHSDHVLDLPDLLLTPWSAPPERKVPLEVWGPDGTSEMMRVGGAGRSTHRPV